MPEGANASQYLYPVFKVDNQAYMLDEWLDDSNKKRGRRSWITYYFYLLCPVDEATKKKAGKPNRLCKLCDKKGRI